jgi:hypothetical protein
MNRFPQDRGPLYTLEQVGERTGIHPMLLQSYLQTAAWRVPTVWVAGEERYPREALVAFRELHEEAQLASAPVAPPAGDGPSWGRRRLLSLTAQRRSAARPAATNGNGNGKAAAAAAEDVPPAAADDAGAAAAEPAASQPSSLEAALARAGADADEEAHPEPRPPGRPLFTLQQVHEHTGIPYPVLALYAASEAGRIPAAGERYAPLYPWEALGVFCRIHHERNPSWQPPALPAEPPAPEEEAAARDLSDRLERLERTQSQLAQQIRSLLDENDELYLTATVWA